ncbi:hypothetical protein CEJ87_08775 [Caldifermentibacillus hisashii]|nr:hypothetical protein CEJ87_08775 [Caldifermentibacillus hisashii]
MLTTYAKRAVRDCTEFCPFSINNLSSKRIDGKFLESYLFWLKILYVKHIFFSKFIFGCGSSRSCFEKLSLTDDTEKKRVLR